MSKELRDKWDILYIHGGKLISGVVIVVLGAIALIRSNPADIPKILTSIFSSGSWCLIGWTIAFLILFFSIVIVSIIFVIYPKEIQRISKERDILQERLLGKPVQHSEEKGK